MTQAEHDRRIDYIEFPARDIAASKRFYAAVFGWTFEDWGEDYASFSDGRLSGGFRADGAVSASPPGVLVVFYVTDLPAAERRVRDAGGAITKPAFDFPGGRRFHFTDPAGNELAVWSES
jgi:hypothetical protein